MQTDGGYCYPSNKICIWLTLVAGTTTVYLSCKNSINIYKTFSLFLSLEGVVLLASAFTPVGLIPPQKGLLEKIRWFFRNTKGITVKFNQWMFYGGLLCIFISEVLSAV